MLQYYSGKEREESRKLRSFSLPYISVAGYGPGPSFMHFLSLSLLPVERTEKREQEADGSAMHALLSIKSVL